MNWTELQLIPTTLPLPDMSANPEFQGADGVELWLMRLFPHAVRCETVRNQNGAATNPAFTPTARFAVTAKAEEYSAADGAKPVEVQYALYFPLDFSCGGLVTLPPPPPVVAGFSPLTGNTSTDFTIGGSNFAGVTSVEIVGGPVGVIQSSTATQIVVRFGSAGVGPVRVTTAGGQGTSAAELTVEDNPPT